MYKALIYVFEGETKDEHSVAPFLEEPGKEAPAEKIVCSQVSLKL